MQTLYSAAGIPQEIVVVKKTNTDEKDNSIQLRLKDKMKKILYIVCELKT